MYADFGKPKTKEPKPLARCSFAEKYYQLLEGICQRAVQSTDLVTINQAKILLLDKFNEWRNFAPRSHQGITNTHICIFEVFMDQYQHLREAEIQLTPPPLYVPAPPLPPTEVKVPEQPQLAGLFLGEKLDEDI
jgi:hypothetical protein